MNVLIKGMKIPNNCDECPLAIKIGVFQPECYVTGEELLIDENGNIRKDFSMYEKRSLLCPMIEQ